jgi:hypothetical protein
MANITKIFNVTKISVTAICTIIFALQMGDIFDKFINEASYIVVNEVYYDKLSLPTITVCPGPSWKFPGISLTHKELKSQSYSMDEIFLNKTLEDLANDTIYKVTETFSVFSGLCYTIKKLINVPLADYYFTLAINNSMDIYYYLHEPMEEEWLFLSVYPFDVSIHNLDTKNNNEIGGADLKVRKEIMTKNSGKNKICTDQSIQQYVTCVRSRRIEELIKHANCTFPLFDVLGIQKMLPYCTSIDEAKKTQRLSFEIEKSTIREKLCVPICTRITYNSVIGTYSQNGMVERDDNEYRIWLYYTSLTVEEKMEKYIYGYDTALVAIGGSMGLFLGFSCLSLVLSGLEWLEKWLQKKNKTVLSRLKKKFAKQSNNDGGIQ